VELLVAGIVGRGQARWLERFLKPSFSLSCVSIPAGREQVLTQIKKIKGLGVFDNYAAPEGHPAFARYNVVYGENGSGKTTFSRLLASLKAGEHPDYPDLEYVVESQSGLLAQGAGYARGVRVFNSDYVEANIGRLDGPLRHILILGEENKAVAEELKNEIATRDARDQRIEAINIAIGRLDTAKGKLFSQIAKTIGEAISGSTLRSYRKPDAEAAFEKLSDGKPLTDDELAVRRATVRQEQMAEIGQLDVPRGQDGISAIDAASYAAARAKALIKRSAQAAVIERLAKNPVIGKWVEEGMHIHTGVDRCEFCNRPLSAERMKALADHFSVEDQRLKEELEAERSMVDAAIEAFDDFALPDRLAFYTELRLEYDATAQVFEGERDNLKAQLEMVREALNEKLTLRTTAYERELNCDTSALASALDALRAVIRRHNDKTASFESEKRGARGAIEAHYLLSIKEQVEGYVGQVNELQVEAGLLRDGGVGLPDQRSLRAICESIVAKQAQVSNAHTGGEKLTSHLKQFLGRTDLRFEPGDDGYQVLRRGKPAKRLSEGEKTAIAFLYFLVQLKDQDFDLAEGVVVIDDPISSLDSSSIYQAFSFLKNGAQGAKQLFILTHNFEFLKLLINWLENAGLRKSERSYTMLLCVETAAGRSARLTSLDKLLIDHATEYHYLFKVLYTFESDGTILSCYHIPNIARKVLETFLDFHVPSNKNLFMKLDQVDFDDLKKTAIYKFANDLSHHTGKGFDPALVTEAQKNVKYLLEMIKEVAPVHYSGLESLSQLAR
jgi:wobble nucleotide-excising tRNase